MKRYTYGYEKKLIDAVEPLLNENRSHAEIASYLNSQQLFTANGSPWTECNMHYFLKSRDSKIFRRSHKTSPKEVSKKDTGIDRRVFHALLTETSLSDKQKLNMLSAYLDT